MPDIDEIAKMMVVGGEPADETGTEEDSEEEVVQESTESETTDKQEETEEASDEDVNVDELEIDVTVDNETKPVKIKDLKARFAGEGAIEKRLQEANAARQYMYTYTGELQKNLNIQVERLKQLDAFIAENASPNINWDELRAKDPGRYLLERDKQRENEARRDSIRRQQQALADQQEMLNVNIIQEKAKEGAQELVRYIPELKDPEKAKVILSDFVRVAGEFGYSPKEVDEVVDPRAMRVLHAAVQWMNHVGKQKMPKPAAQQLKGMLRPTGKSTATNAMDKNRKIQQALLNKAKSSGKVDDIAALLIVDRKK